MKTELRFVFAVIALIATMLACANPLMGQRLRLQPLGFFV